MPCLIDIVYVWYIIKVMELEQNYYDNSKEQTLKTKARMVVNSFLGQLHINMQCLW